MMKCNYRRVGNRILGHGSSHVKTNSGEKRSASGAIASLWALIMSLASFVCALIKGWVTRMEKEEKMDIREELSREVSGLAAVGELGEVRQRLDKVHTLLAKLNESESRSRSPLGSPHDGKCPPWPSARPLPLPSTPQDNQLVQGGPILIGTGRTLTPRGPPSTPRTMGGDETPAFGTPTTVLGDAMTQPDAPATPAVTPRPRLHAWAQGDDGQGHARQPLSAGHSPPIGSRNQWDVHESSRARVSSAGSERGEDGQQQQHHHRQGKGASAQQRSRVLTPPCSVASPAGWSRLAPSSSPLSDLGGACNSRQGQWSGECNKAMTPRGRHGGGGACAALFSGARHNRLEVVQDILGQWTHLVDARDEHGNTCLMLACQNGNKRIVKATLRKGGDINAVNRRGVSALDFCNMFGYVKLAAYLLEKGAVSGDADQRCTSDAGEDAVFDPPPRVLMFDVLVHKGGGGEGLSWDEESVGGESSASSASTCRSRPSAPPAQAPVPAEKVSGFAPFASQGSCARESGQGCLRGSSARGDFGAWT